MKPSTRPSIEVQIDSLVLRGFSGTSADRDRIGGALTRELSRLFATADTPASLTRPGSLPSLPSGNFRVGPGATPELTGARIARAVFRSMNAETGERRR